MIESMSFFSSVASHPFVKYRSRILWTPEVNICQHLQIRERGVSIQYIDSFEATLSAGSAIEGILLPVQMF